MQYQAEIQQQYQQPNTVTDNTVLLRIHAIPGRDTTTVPAAKHSYRKYRTITNTCDTMAEIHNSTSSRIQLQKIPHKYKYMRYHGRDTQQYQQPNTVTENTAQLQTHAIVTALHINNMFLHFYLAHATILHFQNLIERKSPGLRYSFLLYISDSVNTSPTP